MDTPTDAETERQIRELFEEHESKLRQRRNVKRRLGILQEQLAEFGQRQAPAHIQIEADEAEGAIGRLDAEIKEITRNLQRLHNHATKASLFALPADQGKPDLIPAVFVAQNRTLYDEMQSIKERMAEDRAAAREWRENERAERRSGQQTYRLALILLFAMNGVTLILIILWR